MVILMKDMLNYFLIKTKEMYMRHYQMQEFAMSWYSSIQIEVIRLNKLD